MAKLGEGDPRWIVQPRADGRNVNQWHWEEADFTSWTKQRLTELLGAIIIDTDKTVCKIDDVVVKGEVSVNTRKQKTIVLYELDVTLKWSGEWKATASKGNGSIQMPYISEENDDDDFEIKVSSEDASKSDMKDEVRARILPMLKEMIPKFLAELRSVAVEKTKLPAKQQTTAKLDSLEKPKSPSPFVPAVKTQTSVEKSTSFTLKDKFVCRPVDLFECFVEPNRVKAYAGGDSQISREKGGKFKLFSGSVEGENVEVDSPRKLVQKWRFSSWPEGHYSTVTLLLEEKDGKTILKLEQSGVPNDDRERAERGWQTNFFQRIKGVFGYGPLV